MNLEEIRLWANKKPEWNITNTTFADPACYVCGKPTVTYHNISMNGPSSAPSVFKAVCVDHAGEPMDLQATGRSYARFLLTLIDEKRVST